MREPASAPWAAGDVWTFGSLFLAVVDGWLCWFFQWPQTKMQQISRSLFLRPSCMILKKSLVDTEIPVDFEFWSAIRQSVSSAAAISALPSSCHLSTGHLNWKIYVRTSWLTFCELEVPAELFMEPLWGEMPASLLQILSQCIWDWDHSLEFVNLARSWHFSSAVTRGLPLYITSGQNLICWV